MRGVRTHPYVPLLIGVAVVLTACVSGPREIPPDLTKAELFQRAQEAVDAGEWQDAERHYRAFIDRFPLDRSGIAEARYELAFIEYKQDRFAVARRMFSELLVEYEADGAGELPDWPRVLSERLIDIIDERSET